LGGRAHPRPPSRSEGTSNCFVSVVGVNQKDTFSRV
jgi:hypothetical protein